jgi:quinol monooxygenase YgiN
MSGIWTHGHWVVKPGREDEFVQALRALSEDVTNELGFPPPTLLRDREHPNVFLTFGPWNSEQDIERFRAFLFPRLGPLEPLLEGFHPHTLDEVALHD